jgi:quercetin dioxygenase-like cupin family protein
MSHPTSRQPGRQSGRHLVRRAADARPAAPLSGWAAAATGYRRLSLVDESGPAVHTGFGIDSLAPGGTVPAHVHSYESCFFVLSGSPVVATPAGRISLREGDYGLLPTGLPHSWESPSGESSWAWMVSPQPRHRYGDDTLPVPPLPAPSTGDVDVRDPRNLLFGHVEPSMMDADRQSQKQLAVSASMRTALLVYSGITVKMMVDSDLGAEQTTMFMVRYQPDGVAGPHDHPFEETYLFLEGEAEATLDGETYRLGPGDLAFAGVGCVHGFRNLGDGALRWLETQAPQPPGRHSYRFVRDWDYLRDRVDGTSDGDRNGSDGTSV